VSASIGLITILFSIFSGFTLSRARQKYLDENRLFIDVEDSLSRIYRESQDGSAAQQAVEMCMALALERKAVETLTGADALAIDAAMDDQMDILENELPAASERISNLRDSVAQWNGSRSERILVYEWVVIYGLVVLLIGACFAIEMSSLPFLLGRALYVGIIVSVLFAIQDYARGCPRRLLAFILSPHRVFSRCKDAVFLPRVLIDAIRTQGKPRHVPTEGFVTLSRDCASLERDEVLRATSRAVSPTALIVAAAILVAAAMTVHWYLAQ
jgi:hypothetical protein